MYFEPLVPLPMSGCLRGGRRACRVMEENDLLQQQTKKYPLLELFFNRRLAAMRKTHASVAALEQVGSTQVGSIRQVVD